MKLFAEVEVCRWAIFVCFETGKFVQFFYSFPESCVNEREIKIQVKQHSNAKINTVLSYHASGDTAVKLYRFRQSSSFPQ